MIETGTPAPDFTLPRDGGDTVTLSDLRGQKVVLYFYPKDDTSACTREALDFTEALPKFEAEGVAVFGISRDTVRRHDNFREKHGLSVPLLSDAEDEVCEDYGVWVEKKMYGRTFMGIERSTFLIDEDGILRHIWRKVKVPGHVPEVLSVVRSGS